MRQLLEALHRRVRVRNVLAGLRTATLVVAGTALSVTAMLTWQVDQNQRYAATSPLLRKGTRARASRVVSPNRAKKVTPAGASPEIGKPT
jgi:hypothetical protein